mmetsp:Transcript_19816/g.43119  ORF Transcript_19816/g.43119 Transcript_19816/m.43119 type:complete len:119 (-) Transcript_19816:798-1154(-)
MESNVKSIVFLGRTYLTISLFFRIKLMYVFIGASTDTFFGDGTEHSGTAEEGADSPKTDKEIGVDEATHKKMVLFGLCLSTISMSLVSHFVKKELYKVIAQFFLHEPSNIFQCIVQLH